MNSVFSRIAKTARELLSQTSLYWIFALAIPFFIVKSSKFLRHPKSNIPRIGLAPGELPGENGSFVECGVKYVQDGYKKYREGVYKLWTHEMDRIIISTKFMAELNKLPRSVLRLTTSVRYAYTGMDVCEESNLQYEVCAGQLARNVGNLAQPAYDEMLFALNEKLKNIKSDSDGSYALSLFEATLALISSATSKAFVGPTLCRNPEWLSTATSYTLTASKAGEEINTYPRILWPFVSRYLKSYRQVRAQLRTARRLLAPLIRERRKARKGNKQSGNNDMLQWLVDSAKGKDATSERLVRRMLFLNMAAIYSTALTATNVLLDLCARPDDMEMLREEMVEAVERYGGINGMTLNSLKLTDSFMRESRRLNPLGLLTFQRQLTVPFTLSSGTLLPANSYLSLAYYPLYRDPAIYPSPETFDLHRFSDLRQQPGHEDKHQFTSVEKDDPLWAFGKFACPGRQWASAQIKLLLMVLLLEFEASYEDGVRERPENVVVGGKFVPSMSQRIVLRRRGNE